MQALRLSMRFEIDYLLNYYALLYILLQIHMNMITISYNSGHLKIIICLEKYESVHLLQLDCFTICNDSFNYILYSKVDNFSKYFDT